MTLRRGNWDGFFPEPSVAAQEAERWFNDLQASRTLVRRERKKIERLDAENERLRGLLREAASLKSGAVPGFQSSWHVLPDAILDRINAELKEKP
jgi:hypothetical protein